MITYTYKEQEGEEEKVIVKTGHAVEFTMSRMEENEAILLKQKKELSGVIEHRKAVMQNIEENHAFVKDLTEEQRNTVMMHREAEIELQAYKAKEEEVDLMLVKSALEKAEIKKQLEINE